MAIATYSTDLSSNTANTNQGTIYRQDSTTALTTTGCLGTLTWSEPTGSAQGGLPAVDTDYFILGVATADKAFNATGVGGLGVATTNAATLPTDGAFLFWAYFIAPNSISNKVGGGIQCLVGNTLANYNRYYVDGDDTHPYGGWKCYPINPSVTPSTTYGSPTTTRQYFGVAYNVDNAVSKGQPAACGGIRFGRCYIMCLNGDSSNGYATFSGASTFDFYNDATNGWNRLGIVQYINGSYQIQGLLQLGNSITPVDFRDSNKSLFISKSEFVTQNFNTIEIQNVSSRVDFTSISIQSLSSASRGRFLMTHNADVNIDGCSFTDMGTFTFQSNATINSSVFRRCDTITHGGSTIYDCIIDQSNSSPAVTTSNPTTISQTSFISKGTGHAIQITSGGTYTLSGVTFSGYGISNTSNAAIYNSSGTSITINISGGDVPSYNNSTGSSTTIVAASSITLTGLKSDSEVRAYLGTNPSTATEIDGIESSGTSFTFSHSVAGQSGYIQIFHLEYQPVFINITYVGSDISIPIQQITDRQYARGTVYNP